MNRCEVRIPAQPDCWNSCGTCRSDTLTVVELLVEAGDQVSLYQPLILIEAYKTEMEVTSPATGRISDLLVRIGDEVAPDELIGWVTRQ